MFRVYAKNSVSELANVDQIAHRGRYLRRSNVFHVLFVAFFIVVSMHSWVHLGGKTDLRFAFDSIRALNAFQLLVWA